tara:strand:- start:129 stop:656 length:528 start_codon:yes stop_codon:yes gene_type:complete
MRHALIKNGKIAEVVTGLQPDGFVEIQVLWSYPDTYPNEFYYGKTGHPVLSIVGDEVHENWDIFLKPLALVKDQVYAIQKNTRQKMQLGSFDLGGVQITLKDREDSLIISSLPELDTRYKVAQGVWITLSGVEVAALKEAHRQHVQAAYDWEETENTALKALDSHDQIREYLLNI